VARILVVEDDVGVASYLLAALAEAGFQADHCAEGTAAVQQASGYDLLLLDVMLPGMTGLEICRQLRGQGHSLPILLITARDRLEDKVSGLDAGADDYLIKPFQLAELLARVRALLRRAPRSELAVFQVADLSLDPGSRQVHRGGREVRLSSTEFALLEVLMRNRGRVMTRASLLEQVWDYDFAGQDNVLEVYISYLRGKLDKGQDIKLIHTIRGVGYRMDAS
jgi:DNA-binding response OmpR family regulator